MEIQKSIGFNLSLIGKTIMIQLEPLADNEEETLEYAKRLFQNLENAAKRAQHQEIIDTSQHN